MGVPITMRPSGHWFQYRPVRVTINFHGLKILSLFYVFVCSFVCFDFVLVLICFWSKRSINLRPELFFLKTTGTSSVSIWRNTLEDCCLSWLVGALLQQSLKFCYHPFPAMFLFPLNKKYKTWASWINHLTVSQTVVQDTLVTSHFPLIYMCHWPTVHSYVWGILFLLTNHYIHSTIIIYINIEYYLKI